MDEPEERERAPFVLHATSTHAPNDVRIFEREVRSVAAAGLHVTLVCCSPRSESAAPTDADVIAIPRRAGLINRVLGANRTIWRSVKTADPDVVHVHEPELLLLLVRARLRGIMTVFDAHEDFSARASDRLPGALGRLATVLYTAVERALVGLSAAKIVAATEAIAERYGDRALVVHNYPTRAEVVEISQLAQHGFDWTKHGRQRSDIGSYAVYTGLITEQRGVGDLVAAAAVPTPTPWTLVTAGPADDALLDAWRSEFPSARWVHLGVLPRTAALALTCEASVGLIPFRDAANHRRSMPNKMFEYQAAGIPTIATSFPLWTELIDKAGIGATIDCRRADRLSSLITRYVTDTALRQTQGENAARAIHESSPWERDFEQVLKLYRSH